MAIFLSLNRAELIVPNALTIHSIRVWHQDRSGERVAVGGALGARLVQVSARKLSAAERST